MTPVSLGAVRLVIRQLWETHRGSGPCSRRPFGVKRRLVHILFNVLTVKRGERCLHAVQVLSKPIGLSHSSAVEAETRKVEVHRPRWNFASRHLCFAADCYRVSCVTEEKCQ